jgi:hypothetical protein
MERLHSVRASLTSWSDILESPTICCINSACAVENTQSDEIVLSLASYIKVSIGLSAVELLHSRRAVAPTFAEIMGLNHKI